ncbi:adenosine deaminase [Alteromonas aestuariivivens]|uniref:adenosine deaminase n=1 Tax=Alteromonas aestuariivivens TaxID=1938339 RepID=A0A3D8MCB7_9ALTE|nr:adenosine deaminase [Alteromonas aestuariivivens]RDV27333.1 adenosine deaminase [Alteromonas aestuariivivens]
MIDKSLPLVDLHRHLDGNIRPSTIWSLAQLHGIALPVASESELAPLTQIQGRTSDLLAFLEKLDYGVSVLADAQACYRVAYENMQDASKEGLDYVELRFSPYYMGRKFDVPVAEVVEAVIAGVRDGEKAFGVKASLIGILSRTFGAQACWQELQGLLAHKGSIVALDLAGDELGFPAHLFEPHFKLARDAGWQITVHAGEADGPASIWKAIRELGATRIGHGVAAKNDPELIEYLVANDIGIESCPTSNYQTATVADTRHHPMKDFLQAGVAVTLNTDDPGVSAIDLAHEYQLAYDVIGLSAEQLTQIQRNGVHQAFISEAEKQSLFNGALQRASGDRG